MDGGGLSGIHRVAPRPKLLLSGSFHRPGDPGVHPGDLPRVVCPCPPRNLLADRAHGDRSDDCDLHPGISLRVLHGPIRLTSGKGRALFGRAVAAVVFLPGKGLRLAPDPGERGNLELVPRAAQPAGCTGGRAADSGDWRTVALGLLPGDVHRVRVCLVALHDPANPGCPRTGSEIAPGSLRRSGSPTAPYAAPRYPAAGLPRRAGGIDLHLFADPGRFRCALFARQLEFLYRPGGALLHGHGLQHSLGGGLYRGADGDHGLLLDRGPGAGCL